MPVVQIPNQLRPFAGGKNEAPVVGANVGEALRHLAELHPELKDRMFDPSGDLKRFLNVYVNDEDIRFLEDLDTPLNDPDTVALIPNVAGG